MIGKEREETKEGWISIKSKDLHKYKNHTLKIKIIVEEDLGIFCVHCNTKLEEEKKMCAKCGRKVLR